jgi:hypothetical protein
MPDGNKIDQTAIKCTNVFHRNTIQNFPNWYFWSVEPTKSGNPGSDAILNDPKPA